MNRKIVSAILASISLTIFEGLMVAGSLGFIPLPVHAAALTDGIAPIRKSEAAFPARMYAGVIYRGGLVAVSNGVAYPAANNAQYRVIGVAEDTVDNQTTATRYSATRTCVVRQGIFAFANVQTGVDASTNAVYSLQVTDVGKPAYVVDDQTVGASSNALYSVAGTVVYVEPDTKFVWVDVGKAWSATVPLQPFVLPSSSAGLASGRLYSYSNDGTNTVGIVP